ncbi:MAG: GNAT family N-acetyltransferase [Smithella sp.]
MKHLLQIDRMSREEWTQGCASFACNNLYQSWDYGEAHSVGKFRKVSRAALINNGTPVVMTQFQIKRLPVTGIGVADALWGPLWHSEIGMASERYLIDFIEEIQKEYSIKRGLNLRFELRGVANKEQNDRIASILTGNGFSLKSELRPYRTIILDLTQSLDELRGNFNGKWRNALKKAERAGLEAECGSTALHLERFLKIYEEMWAQKRFPTGVRMDAIRAFHLNTIESNRFLIWIIRDGEHDVAAGVFSAMGDTMLYFLGATSPRMRKDSNPGYLIQWLNLRKAIELGLHYYDLGGLTDLPDSGVDQFKIRMGGSRVLFPGWFEAPSTSLSHKAFPVFERGFRKVRDLLMKE